MVQRILERGQIETLASRTIPRIRLPQREQVFARRAERLRSLAAQHPIGDYLRLMAVVADAQQALLDGGIEVALPTDSASAVAAAHRMPPLAATAGPGASAWRPALQRIVDQVRATPHTPAAVATLLARLRAAPDAWTEAQAAALLGAAPAPVDAAAAPFVMAALQVQWVAASAAFSADRVAPLDVPDVCPLCGSLPVASIVHARAPYAGYRYLHCALCATEWHRVRAQCSHCGSGKRVGYYTLDRSGLDRSEPDRSEPARGGATRSEAQADAAAAAVRAEACDECRCYRKILYVEKDAGVEAVADDLASLTLDLLLGEAGYRRASGHPLLWQGGEG